MQEFRIHFKTELTDDVKGARDWYDARAQGLGGEFYRAVRVAIAEVSRAPMAYQEIYKNYRKKFLSRFPYVLYFSVSADEIVFFGLFHCSRDPKKSFLSIEER